MSYLSLFDRLNKPVIFLISWKSRTIIWQVAFFYFNSIATNLKSSPFNNINLTKNFWIQKYMKADSIIIQSNMCME